MPLLPSEIPTGLVTGQFYFVSEDGSDADTDPTLTNVQGTVTFTCSAKMLRMPTKMATVVPLEFKGTFNAQGQLISISDGSVGIELPATDSTLFNPTGFTWTATFDLIGLPDRHTVNLKPITFQVPEGSTVSLTAVTPVDETPGVITIQGPKGDTGATGATGATGPQGIQGIQGVKGDPGGIVLGTSTGTNNLNTITASGLYRQDNSANATLANNYPVVAPGVLTVYERVAGTSLVQNYQTITGTLSYEARVFYTRVLQGGVWSPWRAYASSRVDQTAGRVIYQWDDLNNREQLIYGDTGIRRVETDFKNGWTASIASLRRVGNVVTMGVYNINPTARTADIAYTVPTGFRPAAYGGNIAFPVSHTTAGTAFTQITSVGDMYPNVSAISANGYICVGNWTTADSWPTTLPGTAAGTIPNL